MAGTVVSLRQVLVVSGLYFPVDTSRCRAVEWGAITTRELGETGLRGWLPCHRPDEPELGNTSAGRRTVCDAKPLESFQRLFLFESCVEKE
jgi:hypothetical protein